MSSRFVSIVIPCYNGERFVGEAIECALGQTYSHKEVIVIDDGSTDGSANVLRSFGESIRWETGPNRGGCAARNRGVELARGELIQFLDADDLLKPTKLEQQVEVLGDDRESLTFSDGEIRDSQLSEHVGRYDRTFDENEDPVCYMLRGGMPTPAPLHWRENLIKVGGFREGLPCGQERDLHLRLACAGVKFRHVAKTLYTARQVEGSVSSNLLRVLDQHLEIARNSRRLLVEGGGLTEERAAALAGFLVSDARQYLRHGRREKAREYFREARAMHRDGGIPQACGRGARVLGRLFGAGMTQRFMEWKWRLGQGAMVKGQGVGG